jgi:copper homeostasis protein
MNNPNLIPGHPSDSDAGNSRPGARALEACVETLEEALLAAQYGLDRIELCAALDLGGLTPTAALISACAEVTEVHAMIRPRTGHFVYTTAEMTLMLAEIEHAKNAGAHGVVLGCLDHSGEPDYAMIRQLVLAAKKQKLHTTFHRAFDCTPNLSETLENLISFGLDRILTSGGKPTASEGLEHIRLLCNQAKGRIEVMAGSGVNAENAPLLFDTGVDALHFSVRKKSDVSMPFGMGHTYLTDPQKIRDIIRAVKKNKPDERNG